MTKVAIIGTGPAGCLAAYSALRHGMDVEVFYPPDRPVMSTIGGAQYIHAAIPGLPQEIEPAWLRYYYKGTEEKYRKKLYGDKVQPGGTSWGTFRPRELAWSMHDVYHYCMSEVASQATMVAQAVTADRLVAMVDQYRYVVNTAPLNVIQPEGQYRTEQVTVVNANLMDVPENEIWYLGEAEKFAYRASNIGGFCSTEFPGSERRQIPRRYRHKAMTLSKPLDCEGVDLPGVYRLGRYGKWQKGQLAHHAFDEADRIFSEGIPWTATLPA